MAIIYPCKDCSDRRIGCHSECEKYKDCTDKARQIRDQRAINNQKDDDKFQAIIRTEKRMRKWR